MRWNGKMRRVRVGFRRVFPTHLALSAEKTAFRAKIAVARAML